MDMDASTTLYVAAGVILVGFLVLAVLKGIIKMVLFGASILFSVLVYFWISKNGYSYLAFITSDPQRWMVTTLAWTAAIAVFAVFTHGLFWFSNVFSWGGKMGFGGVKGVLTTVLMVMVLVWVGVVAVFYYGSVADICRAHEFALVEQKKLPSVSSPWTYEWKKRIIHSPSVSWMEKFDPMTDPERITLARLVAYLASFEQNDAAKRYMEMSASIPRPRRLWSLCRDVAVRDMVKKEDMASIMNHPELTKFLADSSSRDALARFPAARFIEQGQAVCRPSGSIAEVTGTARQSSGPIARPVKAAK